MYLGRVVELGDAAQIVARPRHPYTRALVSAVPEFGATLLGAHGEPASALDPPPGCAFHPRCPIAEPACAAPALIPRLSAPPGSEESLAACIRAEVA
jgi:peptide/nickel transport system ATP-binding protein